MSRSVSGVAVTADNGEPVGGEVPLFSRTWLRFALGALAVWLAVTSVVFVDESEFVIVETLGRIAAVYDVADPVAGDRGLHFKWPWPVGRARRFDRRQQLFDPPGREMFTRDRKNVTVAGYVCWKIADPPSRDTPVPERPVVRFFRGLGTAAQAEARLDTRLRSALSTEFGRVELGELLAVASSEAGPAGESPLEAIAAHALDELRGTGDNALRERLGLELVDLRIKRINLPEGNRLAVYERMRTERERIAERYRSAGQAERVRIESQARRQSDELLARADAEAERIRGAGDAEAIRILNEAHAQDPEFYEFQRTLAAYAKVLNERTTLVLSSGSRLFRLLTEGVPARDSEPSAPVPLPSAAREPPPDDDVRRNGTDHSDLPRFEELPPPPEAPQGDEQTTEEDGRPDEPETQEQEPAPEGMP